MQETAIFNRDRARRIAPDVIAIAILAAFLAFFYWDYLVGRSFIWDDTLTEFYPGVNYFAKSISTGRFPLWFLGVRDGIPFYSDPQVAIFYPPQWCLAPFVRNGRLPFLIYQRYMLLHLLLGGAFAYLFLKQLKLNPVAALSGALVFSISAFASLRVVNAVMLQVYAYLPLQLFCIERLVASNSRWHWLILVGAMLLSVLAGYPQMTVYCWYLVSAYWLFRCYRKHRQEQPSRRKAVSRLVFRELPRQAATYAVVLGLSAAMVLPAAQNWRQTSRPKLSFREISDPSLTYPALTMLFVPNFFGVTESPGSSPPVAFWGFDPHSPNVLRNHPLNAEPGYWQYWEFGAYVGQIFWLAILLLLFNWQHIADKKQIAFFLVIWALAVWFMLGRFGGLFYLFYHLVPGVAMFRGATKMSCVASLAAAVLVACAVNLMRQCELKLRTWPLLLPSVCYAGLLLTLSLGVHDLPGNLRIGARLNWARHETLYAFETTLAGAVAIVAATRFRNRWMAVAGSGAVILIVFADFHRAYGEFHRGLVNPDEYFPDTNRLFPLLKEYREQRGPFRFGQIIRGKLGEEIATFRNLPFFHDFLEVPEGYTTLYLAAVDRFQALTNEEAKIAIQNIRVTMERDAQGKDWLGARTNSFPRSKFFSQIRRFDSSDELRHALDINAFDWRTELAIRGNEIAVPEANVSASTNDVVRFESISPESYSIDYHVTRPGVIFVSEAFYPGWIVSDVRIKLIEVFGTFQGLVIPEAGSGHIVVRFSPSVFKLGLLITFLSIGLTIVLASRMFPTMPLRSARKNS